MGCGVGWRRPGSWGSVGPTNGSERSRGGGNTAGRLAAGVWRVGEACGLGAGVSVRPRPGRVCVAGIGPRLRAGSLSVGAVVLVGFRVKGLGAGGLLTVGPGVREGVRWGLRTVGKVMIRRGLVGSGCGRGVRTWPKVGQVRRGEVVVGCLVVRGGDAGQTFGRGRLAGSGRLG